MRHESFGIVCFTSLEYKELIFQFKFNKVKLDKASGRLVPERVNEEYKLKIFM
jgi:hypothetical protein